MKNLHLCKYGCQWLMWLKEMDLGEGDLEVFVRSINCVKTSDLLFSVSKLLHFFRFLTQNEIDNIHRKEVLSSSSSKLLCHDPNLLKSLSLRQLPMVIHFYTIKMKIEMEKDEILQISLIPSFQPQSATFYHPQTPSSLYILISLSPLADLQSNMGLGTSNGLINSVKFYT